MKTQLFNTDSKNLVNIKADLLVTDPPYKLISGGCKTGEMSGKFDNKNYNNNGSIVECMYSWHEHMQIMYDVLKDRAHAYIMCNDKNLQEALNAASDVGFRFHNLLVWNKGTATPNRWFMKNCEFVLFLYKGKAKPINNCGSLQCIKLSLMDETNHPTEKPVELMRHYIEMSSKQGDVVVDPFMGTGATGVAAIQSGRKFIGCEIDFNHYTEASKRMQETDYTPSMF